MRLSRNVGATLLNVNGMCKRNHQNKVKPWCPDGCTTKMYVFDIGMCWYSKTYSFYSRKMMFIHHTTHQNTFLQWCKQSEISSGLKRCKQSFDEIHSRPYYKQSLHHCSLLHISSKDHQKVDIGFCSEDASATVSLT